VRPGEEEPDESMDLEFIFTGKLLKYHFVFDPHEIVQVQEESVAKNCR
jgi:hypothetical protein